MSMKNECVSFSAYPHFQNYVLPVWEVNLYIPLFFISFPSLLLMWRILLYHIFCEWPFYISCPYFELNFVVLSILKEFLYNNIDGVQDTLHQNMAHWHTEYIKLKKFEKHHIQEEFYTFPWNRSTTVWEMPSLYPEERSLLISEDEGMERNLN